MFRLSIPDITFTLRVDRYRPTDPSHGALGSVVLSALAHDGSVVKSVVGPRTPFSILCARCASGVRLLAAKS